LDFAPAGLPYRLLTILFPKANKKHSAGRTTNPWPLFLEVLFAVFACDFGFSCLRAGFLKEHFFLSRR